TNLTTAGLRQGQEFAASSAACNSASRPAVRAISAMVEPTVLLGVDAPAVIPITPPAGSQSATVSVTRARTGCAVTVPRAGPPWSESLMWKVRTPASWARAASAQVFDEL